MTTNIKAFERELQALTRTMPRELVTTVHRKLTLDIAKDAILLTPVDTGRLRGGWQVAIGETVQGPTGEDKSGAAALAAAAAVAAQIPAYSKSVIANNVEYAIYVEEGTERMAPRRMLARSIERARQALGGGGA